MSFFKVFGHHHGGYAEYTVVKESETIVLPRELSGQILGGVSLVGVTCLQAFDYLLRAL